MSIVSEIEQQRISAKAALLSGDYDTAINVARATLLDLAVMPDGEKEGDAGAKLSWDREAIQAFITEAKSARTEASASTISGGMSIHPVQYTRDCG